MTSEKTRSTQSAPAVPPHLSADDIKAYLREHPNFLAENPDLVERLAPPGIAGGRNVHDMQQFMVRRLQDEVGRLRDYQSELIAASRSNMSVQAQVHEAALSLLEAANFEHLIHIVTTDLAQVLDVDAVTLCVEQSDEDGPRRAKTAGVYVLEPGAVDALIGERRDILLASDMPGEPAVFGPATRLVRSQALLRLHASRIAPVGLLAFGSRDGDRFHPGQGTELLNFLARMLERLIRGWLHLPA